jgi:hypothetical protein
MYVIIDDLYIFSSQKGKVRIRIQIRLDLVPDPTLQNSPRFDHTDP